ncbi:MAG TPA: STAS domain-containing protein [Candidatus Aquicultor sp.]|jgi:anti-anti-sigma factor
MFDVAIRNDNASNCNIITLSGDWDLYEKEKVERLFAQVMSESPASVIVDLTGIKFLDSSAVSTLIFSFIGLQKIGVPMVLVARENNYLLRKFRQLGIFDGTGLLFYDSVETAQKELFNLP